MPRLCLCIKCTINKTEVQIYVSSINLLQRGTKNALHYPFPDAVTCEVTTRSYHTFKGTSSLKPIICGRLKGIITGQMCNHGFIYGRQCPRVRAHPDTMMPPFDDSVLD